MVIQGMLEKLGMHCDLADNGEQALDRYIQNPSNYDLVLMDCEMPVMDGYSTCRKLRRFEQQQQLPPIPVLALSAHATREHQQHTRQAGMNEHITKPIQLATLKSQLLQYLAPPPQQPPAVNQ
jgi:CheY-like chemotaxis protein